MEVLLHGLVEMERIDQALYDIVVMLQPTCPLRTRSHVEQAVAELVRGGWDSVWTVSPADLKYHPLKQLCIDGEGRMSHFDRRGREIIARQQLSPTFVRNGAAYALTRSCLVDQKSTLGQNAGAVVLDEPLISIDTLEDFLRVEQLLA
jgi:CMP-N-acetylneuraminic acid synthetase